MDKYDKICYIIHMNPKEKPIKIPEVATVSHTNHRQRLYSRIEEIGLENTDDFQTLEFILTLVLPRVDTNPISHRLLEQFGSISAALDASPEELEQVRGLGKNASRLLSLFPDLFARYNQDKLKNTKLILTRGQAIKYCVALLSNKERETLYAICLDKSLKVLSTKMLATGTAVEVKLTSKEFLRQILMVANVEYVLITHSHPNNSPNPSQEDKTTTNFIKRALESVNLKLYDHIIVGLTHSYSFTEDETFAN